MEQSDVRPELLSAAERLALAMHGAVATMPLEPGADCASSVSGTSSPSHTVVSPNFCGVLKSVQEAAESISMDQVFYRETDRAAVTLQQPDVKV